jgi:tetratricopeptide (TPR) repeat protein
MFALKPISHHCIENALAKAERYRLLGEPNEAESICLDILEIDPANRQAQISLILALTDEIPQDSASFNRAMETIPRLASPYDRAYYYGIAWERRAKAAYAAGGRGPCGHLYDWLVKALGFFEEAERLRPPGNDSSILRWNACVRFLERHKELAPMTEAAPEPILSE